MNATYNRLAMRGFSVVELMVAMAIGILVLAAVSTVLVNSKKNYTTQDSLARLQENARFAMQFITRDLRMAGYYGCADDLSKVNNTVNGGAGSGNPFDSTAPLQGSENKGSWQPQPGVAVPAPGDMEPNTDAVALRYLDGSTAVIVDEPYMKTTAAALHINGTGLRVGEIVMVMDCSSASVFQITGPGNSGDPIDNGTVVHNDAGGGDTKVPGNSTKDLGKVYEGDAKIAKFYYASYYIRKNPNGEPSLYREILKLNTGANTVQPDPQELVEGIENLQILYGIDSASGDGIPDTFKKADAMAATDWGKVITVRFGILARTLANAETKSQQGKQFGTDLDTNTYDIDGDGITDFTAPGDRYQRRVFRSTVVLRNLQ